ncbi:MAG: hypothetical protein AAB726_01755 [Patescibacteria group bacterium]
MKKIFWTLIIIVLAAALGLGAYWFFDRQENGGPSMGNISIGDFFPFGTGGTAPITETPADTEPIISAPAPITRLWKISSAPQAGTGLFTQGTETFVRFIDSAMGNVYEAQVSNREALQASMSGSTGGASAFGPVRISNTTIPKIKEALWQGNGAGVILRYVNDAGVIQTMHAKVAPMQSATSTEANLQELSGAFLPGNITNIAHFTAKDRIFYMLKNGGASGVGYTALIDGKNPAKIFESPINEWTASWPREATIVITTKPSAAAFGYSYTMSPATGALSKLLGGIAGLSVAPAPNMTKILYSEAAGSSLNLKLFDVKTGVKTELTQTKTLADKCIWMKDSIKIICAVPKTLPGANYPDNWYDGQISFNDSIWSIDTGSGEAQVIADLRSLSTSNEEIDATNLALDASEKILIFTNIKDSSLWGFDF